MFDKQYSRLVLRASFLLVALMLAVAVHAQEARTTNIGQIQYTTNEAFTADDMRFPIGFNAVDNDMMHTYGITVGVRRTWMPPDGTTSDFQVAQVMESKFNDFETVVQPVSGAFSRTFRNPYPDKILDGTNWTQSFDQSDPVSASIPSDAMVYNKALLWPNDGMGMQVERWMYLFGSDAEDHIVVMEYLVSNVSGEARDDVYIGLNSAPHSSAHYPADLWGNYYGVTYPKFLAGDAASDSMRVWYAWRADQTVSSPAEDDKGDPDSQWGHFKEGQFMANVVLHADTSPIDESDDPGQPIKAGWSQRDFVANLNEADQPTTYQYLSAPWNTGPNPYAEFVDFNGDPVESGFYRVLKRSGGEVPPKGVDFTALDPELEQEKNNLMSFGPYQMAAGEDVRIVMAFVGASIPSKLLIDAGRAYDGGQSGRATIGTQPLPSGVNYDDMMGNPIVRDGNVFDIFGNQVASAGSVLSQQEAHDIIDIGQQLVFQGASKAIRMFKGSDVKAGAGSFNMSYSPGAPSMEGFSENDRIRLTWTPNQADPRGGTIAGYNIYREYRRGSSVTAPTDTTFLLLAQVGAGVTEYVDETVVRGEDNYYYITSVNEDGVESSRFQNRTGTSANKEDEALTPTRSPDANWKTNVVVVPNPYHTQAAVKYPGRRLNFLNLPPYANVHIYTMTGDRIQTLEHNTSTGDIDWERQDTFSSPEIVSGVYIYVVEELDSGGNATGEEAIGKFVVIK